MSMGSIELDALAPVRVAGWVGLLGLSFLLRPCSRQILSLMQPIPAVTGGEQREFAAAEQLQGRVKQLISHRDG